MRIETLPVIFGILIGLFGVLLAADAWLPDYTVVPRERRRTPRAERSRLGEGLIGFALVCMAAALIGRDRWRFGTLAVILGTIAFAAGVWYNVRFLREVITHRGAARRHPAGAPPEPRRPPPGPVTPKERREKPR